MLPLRCRAYNIFGGHMANKKVVNFGVAWEGLFGYVQGIQVKDTVYLSGQLSHDRQGNRLAVTRGWQLTRPRR